eukprot:5120924-Heterocapsa_arctica.AAC.1
MTWMSASRSEPGSESRELSPRHLHMPRSRSSSSEGVPIDWQWDDWLWQDCCVLPIKQWSWCVDEESWDRWHEGEEDWERPLAYGGSWQVSGSCGPLDPAPTSRRLGQGRVGQAPVVWGPLGLAPRQEEVRNNEMVHLPRAGWARAPESKGSNEKAAKGDWELEVESFNSTAWKAMKERLAETSAHIVCGQELHLLGQEADHASDWARKHGWKSIILEAIPGKSEPYSSGGVGIFVRDWLGMQE